MDDIIVYLIFVAFALLSRFLTKKKEPETPPKHQRQQEDAAEPRRDQRPPSFEELLREFTEEKKPAERKPIPVEVSPKTPSPYKSYEDDTYEVENYEDQYARDEEAREVYNRSVRQAKELKTIDELVDDSTKTKSDYFDPYEKKRERKSLADDIRKQLQDPVEVRKAVIYAEILQRKY